MVIDFLYLDLNTCERCIATGGTLDEALNTLAPVFQAMNYTVHVNKVNITTKELAEQYRFISSPTIRVNGMDICTEVKESNCKDCGDLCGDTVDCRVFVYEGNAYEQPPAAMLIDGILKVIHGQQPHEDVPYTLPANLQRFFAGKSGGCDSGKSNEGENPMKEINKNEPCCEKISTPASCACSSGACDSGNPVGRKTLKTAICFVVLLAAVSIVGYRTINADNSSKIVPSDTAAFIFGQPAVASTSPLTGQNIGENLESLNALNTVAAKSDAVFVFIPASGADVIDDTIRNAIAEAQLTLIKNNIKVGVYTLSQNSTDFSGIAKQVELPAILVARKGAKAAFISGSNANAKTLLQAYLACCDTSSSSCCPN
ncbi:MAG: DUF2703 domain-containing protein [Desulfovibrionaceae bacterium]|nr:DUF2703 domain-containing protein [Desulfovibrionaceae bacterium]